MAPFIDVTDNSMTVNGIGSNGTAQALPRRKLRIAIIGSGLAGATAGGLLTKLPDVEVKIYEKSDVVREVGALIGVAVSAMKTLSRCLSPEGFEQLQYILYRGPYADGINHRHWKTGEVLKQAVSPHTPRHLQEGRTSRVPLHRILMNEVPEGVVQHSRSAVSTEKITKGDDAGAMQVTFTDGTSEIADVVVAADGLYSKIRRHYHPDSQIASRGRVAYRYTFPTKLIEHIKDLPEDTSSFRKHGEIVFLSRLEPGVYAFTALIDTPDEEAAQLEWAKPMGQAGLERLRRGLEGWNPIIHRVIDVLPDIQVYPLQTSEWMRSLVRDDAVAFVGDAAHPTAGAYGAGCSFAFNDVWCLYRSLGSAHDPRSSPRVVPYHVPYALHLYNESRVHFLHRVERQIQMDKRDYSYIRAAGDDHQEWVRRYKERFTINWWLLEHDAEAEWQMVESEVRFRRDEFGLGSLDENMASVDLGAAKGLAPHLGAF
ncbi:uncharacterized protein PV07_00111 [Cladophialophora immunda]|uniref:FAD-binding domain-containing protein n=1 Tax=Cladophialophora immunda TaxID=569365 RepID=A0A0D2CTJ0_9EURO|nr:uncharacterized protein PV07_00111 [Cladophialophora immunda]KIW33245.1 hypothetical protein PV07_00111 [Cladophialophora immunda]